MNILQTHHIRYGSLPDKSNILVAKRMSQRPEGCSDDRTIVPAVGRLFQQPNVCFGRPDDCSSGWTITPAYHSGGRILLRIVTPVPPDKSQFKEGLSWDNYGDWHIDIRMPLRYKLDGKTPTLEEVAQWLHYTNTQPLWASENIAKCNRHVS